MKTPYQKIMKITLLDENRINVILETFLNQLTILKRVLLK